MWNTSAGSLDPVFACRVTLSDLVRWRDKKNSGHLFPPRALWGGMKCCGCVKRVKMFSIVFHLPSLPFSTFRPVKKRKDKLLRGGQTISGDAVLHFVLQDKHTSSGNDIDEFVVFLLFVCSEEVSGACGDQTTLEDLVRIYFIFLFFYLIFLYIPTFYTLARMS